VCSQKQLTRLQPEGLVTALGQLDARSRRIDEARWLPNGDGSGGTLHTLAEEFSVSAEQIRQIESAALKRTKDALAAFLYADRHVKDRAAPRGLLFFAQRRFSFGLGISTGTTTYIFQLVLMSSL
jgi:hypothetical protein